MSEAALEFPEDRDVGARIRALEDENAKLGQRFVELSQLVGRLESIFASAYRAAPPLQMAREIGPLAMRLARLEERARVPVIPLAGERLTVRLDKEVEERVARLERRADTATKRVAALESGDAVVGRELRWLKRRLAAPTVGKVLASKRVIAAARGILQLAEEAIAAAGSARKADGRIVVARQVVAALRPSIELYDAASGAIVEEEEL